MEKSSRDRVLNRMSQDERHEFRQLLQEIRAEMKASSGRRISAGEVLESKGGDLSPSHRSGLEAVIERDRMGPNEGDQPPNFDLKRMGSDERVRLSSFQGKKPVAITFGSYT